jgi:hypothetical protein
MAQAEELLSSKHKAFYPMCGECFVSEMSPKVPYENGWAQPAVLWDLVETLGRVAHQPWIECSKTVIQKKSLCFRLIYLRYFVTVPEN